VWINKNEIKRLSAEVRKIIDGQPLDIRTHREGAWAILRNDIHTLANIKNEQMEALKREHDNMCDTLANISHQLKTPLTSMMIMADLLENAPPDKHAEFLTNIKVGLARMEWLAAAILKMAGLDAGAVAFASSPMASGDLIALAAEPLHILLEINNQTIQSNGDITLSCDKRWTAEALTNVIKNAAEHSPAGGVISIQCGNNPLCQWISVTDSGTGIPKAQIGRLFKRFEGTRGGKGHGIGLSLALAIVRGQNGDIEVDGGGNGTGATFTLKFFK